MKELVKEKITVNRDAITGNKLNHNCEVVIFESIGRKLVLFLILICNQKTDNGYIILEKVINLEGKIPFSEYSINPEKKYNVQIRTL